VVAVLAVRPKQGESYNFKIVPYLRIGHLVGC